MRSAITVAQCGARLLCLPRAGSPSDHVKSTTMPPLPPRPKRPNPVLFQICLASAAMLNALNERCGEGSGSSNATFFTCDGIALQDEGRFSCNVDQIDMNRVRIGPKPTKKSERKDVLNLLWVRYPYSSNFGLPGIDLLSLVRWVRACVWIVLVGSLEGGWLRVGGGGRYVYVCSTFVLMFHLSGNNRRDITDGTSGMLHRRTRV